MARCVLVPVDFTDRCAAALREACRRTVEGGEVVLLHAIDPACLGHQAEMAHAAGLPFADQSIVEDCAIHLRQLRDSVLFGARSARLLIRQGPAAVEVVRAVAELRPDLVVFAADEVRAEPGGGGDGPGHMVRAVIDGTTAPVLVVWT